MSELPQLRREHDQSLEIVGRLSKVIALSYPPAAGDLFRLRHELSSVVIAHLKSEDWLLYPRLLKSPSSTLARKARAFSDEMGGLAGVYATYADEWTAHRIEDDWVGYCEETCGLVDALIRRIERENKELYPLLEQLDKAA